MDGDDEPRSNPNRSGGPSTRERLLEVTEKLIAERGTHGVGLNEVCRVSGVAYGSLYHAFPGGKNELVASSMQRSGAMIGEVLQVLLASSADVPKACRAIFEFGAMHIAGGEFQRGCPVGTPASDGLLVDEVRAAGDAAFTEWATAIEARLVTAGAEREPARTLASTMVSLYEGALLVARTRRDVGPLNDAAALAERLATELLDGSHR